MGRLIMDDDVLEHPCKGCPIKGRRDKVKLSVGKKAKFLIVTKPVKPGADGRVLSEGASGVLSYNLKEAGFKRSDFSFMPSVRCGFDKDIYPTADKKEIVKRCRVYLNQVIAHLKPEVIVPLGVDAAQMVEGRAVKISKARGVLSHNEEHDTYVMPTYDPEFVFQRPENEPLFASDCRTLRRLVDHDYDVEGAGKEVLGDYKYVDDLQFLVDMKPKLLAVDIEATGLDWYRPNKILTLQFTTKPGEAFVLVWDHPEAPKNKKQKIKLLRQLKKILCRRKTRYIGANLKFDMAWILSKLGIRGRIDEDVIMMAAILDENLQNKGLDTLTKLYAKDLAGYADHFNATHDKGDMISIPLKDLLPYAGGDSDATMRVFLAMEEELKKDKGMYRHYRKVSIPGLNGFLQMERPGSLIDEKALEEFEVWLIEDVKKQRASLMSQVPKPIKRAHMRAFAGKGKDIKDALSFTRPDFTRDVLFNHPNGFRLEPKVFTKTTKKLEPKFQIPSVSSKDHLPYFYQDCPFTYELAQYIKDERILGTNVRSYKKKYIYKGYVHPIYGLHTAVTGRANSYSPNGQNTIKRGKNAKKYNRIFIPPKDRVLIFCDLGQAELRIVGDMANDPTMLDIYNRGADIHKRTACIVMGISEDRFDMLPRAEQGLARFKAKACIAKGQLVLTNSGLIPIESVTTSNLVWDGVEFVNHDGVVYKGYKEVMTYEGLTATPDHRVYTEEEAAPSLFLECSSKVSNRRIVASGDGEVPIRIYPGSNKESAERGNSRYECSEDVQETKKEGKAFAHVYDIVNAGPRHRFTCSNLLVSNCNFGYVFKMHYKSFVGYAKTQYGIDFTEQEAKNVSDGFFAEYSRVGPWHEEVREFVLEHGYVRSYSGRVRHLPNVWSDERWISEEAIRQGINSPVQEFASSLGVMSIDRMMKEIDQNILQIFRFVHDAIYATVPPEYVEWGMKTIKHYMESNPIEEMFGVKLKLPIVADAEFGMNGADTYEASGLELGHDYDFKKLFKSEVGHIKDDDKLSKKERGEKIDKTKLFRDTILGKQSTPASGGRVILPKYLR